MNTSAAFCSSTFVAGQYPVNDDLPCAHLETEPRRWEVCLLRSYATIRRGVNPLAIVVCLLILVSCGSQNSGVGRVSTDSRSNRTGSAWPCEPEQAYCSPSDILETMTGIFEIGGATTDEARCLGAIVSRGKRSTSGIFDVPKMGETQEAIECVNSESRLRDILSSIGANFATWATSSTSSTLANR